MRNAELAELFREIADLYEMRDVQWKPRAYRRAAQSIEGLGKDIAEIAKKGDLDDIPGVGERMADHIKEFLKTGKIKELERMRKKTPVKVRQLMQVEGVGPKTVKLLYKKLGVKDLHDLEQAARKGKIADVKGLGAKTQKNILEAIGFAKSSKGRSLYARVLPVAEEIKEYLQKSASTKKVEVVGSLRRAEATIGDVDILTIAKDASKVMEAFLSYDDVQKVLAKGKTKSSVILHSGLRVDLRVLDPDEWGAGLLYFTGSKQHNIALRKIAIKKGLKLNEYGLFKGDKRVAGKTEKGCYKKLGLPFIPAELRQDAGELEAAKKGRLPKLVEWKDLKGDLHLHTKASDGADTIEAMAKAVKALGLSYTVVSDHTGHLQIAGALRGKALLAHIDKIKKVQKRIKGFTLLTGAEVDITDDGELDIDKKALKRLDVVVASIHSGLKQSKKKVTDRILSAMDQKMHILGHPTGRLIGKRPGFEFDAERVFKKAEETGTALEVDGQPARLDLPPALVRKAIEKGVKISLSSDAHATAQVRYIHYALAQARRGWAEKKDILNTMTASKLKSWAKKRS